MNKRPRRASDFAKDSEHLMLMAPQSNHTTPESSPGKSVAAPADLTPTSTYDVSRWLLFRILGAAYLVVFVSLWPQISGLLGPNGISPVSELLERVTLFSGAERYYFFPTLCWLGGSDVYLHLICLAGVIAAICLTIGLAQGPCLVILWMLHLSLSTVSEGFLSSPGDRLLLEVGFLSVFLARFSIFPSLKRKQPPSIIILWLLRLVLFRVIVWPGVTQLGLLVSGAPDAPNLSMGGQPAPTWLSWYVHQSPAWLQHVWSLGFLAVALTVPFLLFMPRRFRLVACAVLVSHQALTAATGGQVFFAALVAGLCILALDDGHWTRYAPRVLALRIRKRCSEVGLAPVRSVAIGMATVTVLVITIGLVAEGAVGVDAVPPQMGLMVELSEPFQIVNRYDEAPLSSDAHAGLIIEGSYDGQSWQAYELPRTSGDMTRRPSLVRPHLARLDTLMESAARSDISENPWVVQLMTRLLEGSPEVLGLFQDNPFPEGPPNYVRAVRYEYRFSNTGLQQEHGIWWRRESRGLYCPVLSNTKPEQIASLVAPHWNEDGRNSG